MWVIILKLLVFTIYILHTLLLFTCTIYNTWIKKKFPFLSGLTYHISHKSPVATHGSLTLERHNRIEYTRVVQLMQKRDVFENLSYCFPTPDEEASQSSVSSLSNYSFLFVKSSIALLWCLKLVFDVHATLIYSESFKFFAVPIVF